MSDSFSIGEVAWHVLWGCAVTIKSELRLNGFVHRETGMRGKHYAHAVIRHDGLVATPGLIGWGAEPKNLRKIPPHEPGMGFRDLVSSLKSKERAS